MSAYCFWLVLLQDKERVIFSSYTMQYLAHYHIVRVNNQNTIM